MSKMINAFNRYKLKLYLHGREEIKSEKQRQKKTRIDSTKVKVKVKEEYHSKKMI